MNELKKKLQKFKIKVLSINNCLILAGWDRKPENPKKKPKSKGILD